MPRFAFSEIFVGLTGKETLFLSRLRAQETIWGKNVSAAMFPRLQGPYGFSYSPRIFSIIQYSTVKKCNAFYKTALPVYLRDYLSKGDPQLSARDERFLLNESLI